MGVAPNETRLVSRRRWCIPLPFSKRDPSRRGAEQVKITFDDVNDLIKGSVHRVSSTRCRG